MYLVSCLNSKENIHAQKCKAILKSFFTTISIINLSNYIVETERTKIPAGERTSQHTMKYIQ